ncbi:hypothetical protein D3C87_1459240 [compost metagenome]
MDAVHRAEVADVDDVEAEIAEVVVDGGGKLLLRHGRQPFGIRAASCRNLGDDGEIVRIGMQRFTDDLIGDMRTVEIAGVDMIDAGLDGGTQNGDSGSAILRRSEDARAGKLHCTVADALDRMAAHLERAGFCKIECALIGHGDAPFTDRRLFAIFGEMEIAPVRSLYKPVQFG